jgi:adenylate cyclase
MRTMRLKTAVTLFVLGGTFLAALPLQWVWWWTARQSSLQLVDALSEQITSTVRREWWGQVTAAEAAYDVAASLLDSEPNEGTVGRALGAALAASQVPSAATFDGRETGRLLANRASNGEFRMRKTPTSEAPQPAAAASWRDGVVNPDSEQPAITYQGFIEAKGALAVYIGIDRFSSLLGAIPVGRTGAALVVDARGGIKVAPALGPFVGLKPVAQAAGAIVAARPSSAVNIVEARRIVIGDAAYRVSLSPLEFKGWQFVVIVPEAEFLSDIDRATRQALIGLLGLALAVGVIAALLAQRILSEPVAALTGDLRKIEHFELEGIPYRHGRLREYDQLSAAIARMASGLADFAKFIPTDLVRMLLADGVRAAPGGETRQLTVMFADVAGFTKLSERMGIAIIDVISRYLDVVSRTVETNGGTVDKFIGDAVMAFWGAPRTDADQARNACLAALAAIEAVREAGITDDQGAPLQVRIGLHSGAAVVGNIGSERRLNYTAIGDTVNLASRLEGVNKVFGTSILISEATKAAIGGAFVTRELAEVSVVGRAEAVRVHELLGTSSAGVMPDWAQDYEMALMAYRQRKFVKAIRILDGVLKKRPEDGPSRWLTDLSQTCRNTPPPSDWRGVAVLDAK